ncbi:30S ribosomal protein S16 [Candidatus Shikimatogenerans bostrichidophilus]|uniref:30S ribosomal protein S16 n=1 Tax=Candidatus Shikimatogenerans bostrichidophilus TaxID=2943807 RepID=UPI0029660CA2
MLKIRLQRKGKKHYPIYSIVVTNSDSPRNGKIIEKLGIYNPIKKIININKKKTIKWLNNGARTTNTVNYIIKLKNIKLK